MRVIGGSAKGMKLAAVPGSTTRPILDRVKTSLFDILRPELTGMKVLDVFAGSGAVGIEALSQGADHCIFLDLAKAACATIKKNLEHTGLSDRAQVRHTDAFRYLRNTAHAFNLVYVAPPQYKSLWEQSLQTLAERPDLVLPGGLVVVQIDPKEYELTALSEFEEEEQRRYGNTLLVFFRRTVSA